MEIPLVFYTSKRFSIAKSNLQRSSIPPIKNGMSKAIIILEVAVKNNAAVTLGFS